MTRLARDFTRCPLGWSADAPDLLARCQLLLLDGVAVAAAGATQPGPTHMAELSATHYGEGVATLIHRHSTTTPLAAARINGMSMHVLDFEPMWNPPNHAVSTLLPALLALAEQLEHDTGEPHGDALLRAFAKGIEAQGRLRLSSGQLEPAQLSLHPPGVVGPLATALACADLLGLDDDAAIAALGIAASRSGGLLANVGSQTKALHCGDAAANGLEAALLAQRGFTANDDALGGPRGWGRAYFGERFDEAPLLVPIGAGRALTPGPAWKLFPSQYATHFAITAALDARAQLGGIDPADIERIELHVPSMPYIDRPRPQNGLDGKFSWQYTSVVALLDGRVDFASFADERRFASDVESLLPHVTLNADAAIPGAFDRLYVDLAVLLKSGRRVEAHCAAPLGSWSRPVDAAAIEAKARSLLEAAFGPQRADEAMHAVANLPARQRVRELMQALR
jgi:aconitate decarboxylase